MAENVLEAVERLDQVIGRIERLMYGEPPGRPGGLIAEVEGVRRDVQGLREDVQRLKVKRNNPWLWVAGFVVYVVATAFGIVGAINLTHNHSLLDIPAAVALFLALVFCAGALLLFLGGFGWLSQT